jgi:hypothetical protein
MDTHRRASLPISQSISDTRRRASLPASKSIPDTKRRASLPAPKSGTIPSSDLTPFEVEFPRWRAAFSKQSNTSDSDLPSRIMEKSMISFGIGYFLIFLASIVGFISTRIFGFYDLGILLLWINQFLIVALFLIEPRIQSESEKLLFGSEKRADNMKAVEIIQLFCCQIFPWIVVWWYSMIFSYHGFAFLIGLQLIFKTIFMKTFALVVEIPL